MKLIHSIVTILMTIMVTSAQQPEWVRNAGYAAEYPMERWFTGFGVSDYNGKEIKKMMESAKDMALTNLAETMRMKILSMQTLILDQNISNGYRKSEDFYKADIFIKSSAELENISIRYYLDYKNHKVYALAALNKSNTIRACEKKINGLLKQLGSFDTLLINNSRDRLVKIIVLLEQIEKLNSLSLICGMQVVRYEDVELLKRYAEIGERIINEPAQSVKDLSEKLFGKLCGKMLGLEGRILICPICESGKEKLSSIGVELYREMERNIVNYTELKPVYMSTPILYTGKAVLAAAEKFDAQFLLIGTYTVDRLEDILFEIRIVEVKTGIVSAVSNISLKTNSLEWNELNTVWYGGDSCNMQGAGGGLNLEVWTEEGGNDLILEEGKKIIIYVKVNKPCYLLYIHELFNGINVIPELMYSNYFLDLKKTNQPFRLPDTFTVEAPFGNESLHFYISERPFPDMIIVNKKIDGRIYSVLNGAAEGTKKRGFVICKNKTEVIEKTLNVRTIRHSDKQ